jgi:integrase
LSHDHCKAVRYNRGMLRKEQRAIGMVWVFRWSEEVNGQRRQHKDVIGTTKEFPTETAANREADRLRCRLNENKQSLSLKSMTFGELINHYINHELPRLSKSARKGNKSYIKNWIEPSWHGHLAGSMKSMRIQEWLDTIKRPDGTKLKIKNVLSTIFSHGVRWELVERNPICGQGGTPGHRGASTGVRQSNRVSITRVTLQPDVVSQALERLPLREATMALLDAVTALRASELIALKWKNVGWDTGILQSQFAFVEGELKETKSRNNALPLAEPVLQVLRLWRDHTPYRSDEDWIFASPHYHGKTPYTYQILFRRHIRPVIEKISGLRSSKQAPIGWHTLRRSLATLLISNGENVKVAQSQLRHTTPKITLELYAQAVSADQQKAHNKVVQMVLPMSFSEKLKARSATSTV